MSARPECSVSQGNCSLCPQRENSRRSLSSVERRILLGVRLFTPAPIFLSTVLHMPLPQHCSASQAFRKGFSKWREFLEHFPPR